MRLWIGRPGNRPSHWIRRLVRRAIWPFLFLLVALYVVVFVPIMPYRVSCYDGDIRWLEGTPVYPFTGALLWELAVLKVDYTAHFGLSHVWKPKADMERLADDVLNWQAGDIRVRLFDWLDGNDLDLASGRAVTSLLFEGYGADPDQIPDHIKEMVKGGLTRLEGPYVHTDCELTRAVAFDWHKVSSR